MLDRGAESCAEQRCEYYGVAAGVGEREKGNTRDRCAEREEVAFAEALGDETGRNLEARHRSPVSGAYEADLRERQAERLRQQRQQHVGDVREAVVQRMGCATGGECAARTGCGQRYVPLVLSAS